MELTSLLFISNFGAMEMILVLIVMGIPFIIWLWALIDVLRSNFSDSTNKLVWIIVIAFLPFVGAILYFLIGRRQKAKPSIRH